ncbi:MAG: serpin family protein [Clostridia bacterium]|nr:serpin family protein [Clostridia bacterium]MBQ5957262.1 serpin family protein [Clostridia bacterium]MBR6136486.1 serpin family protein [Clostridia bacterium]
MKRILCLIICIMMLLTMVSCSRKTGIKEPENNKKSGQAGTTTGKPAVKTNVKPKKSDYGQQLLDMLYKKGENVLISDLSLKMCLAMVAEGAQGDTLKELETYLGCSVEEYRKFAADYLKDLPDSENIKIMIANSYWKDKNLKVKEGYAKVLQDSYEAEYREVVFRDKETAALINGYVKDKTKGLIDKIVDYDTIKEAALMLMNVLYFKSTWLDEVYLVEKNDFRGLDETKEKNMLRTSEDTYFENDKAIGFAKPYTGRYEFVAILPKTEGDFKLEDLDLASFIKSRNDTDYMIHTKIPELDISSGGDLTEILKNMGIQSAFIPDYADLSLITDEQMYIYKVIQKTKLKLDKDGTEAAAVTIAVANCESAFIQEKEEKEVYLDRPFAFMIYDNQTDTALFTGKVMMP